MVRGRNLICAAAFLLSTVTARASLVTFDTAGDLANNFNTSATLAYTETDGVGIGNPASRGLGLNSATPTQDTGATYKNGSMSFTNVGDAISVSGYFHTAASFNTTTELRIFELNAVSLVTNLPTAAHTGIGAKLAFTTATSGAVVISFRQNNADVAASIDPTSFAIQPNTWYKATFTATDNGTASTIPASMVLDDYGSDATALATASVYSYSFNLPASATFTADPDVFGAFRIRNGTKLMTAFDQFEQIGTPAPEPASIGLLSLGLMSIAGFRRRGK